MGVARWEQEGVMFGRERCLSLSSLAWHWALPVTAERLRVPVRCTRPKKFNIKRSTFCQRPAKPQRIQAQTFGFHQHHQGRDIDPSGQRECGSGSDVWVGSKW